MRHDSTKNGRNASFEDGVALHLPGVTLAGSSSGKSINRAAHFAGGLLKAAIDGVGETYTVELWFWNGLPSDVRPITGHLLSFGARGANGPAVADVGIGGTSIPRAILFFSSANATAKIFTGETRIAPKTWHHVAFERKGRHVVVYLDGNPTPEISGEIVADAGNQPRIISVGGRGDGVANFEGKIDEVALFDRALSAEEIAGHFRASRIGRLSAVRGNSEERINRSRSGQS